MRLALSAVCFIGLASSTWAAKKEHLVIGQSVSYHVIPHENVLTLPLSESVTTHCSTTGNTKDSTTTCSSNYTPAADIPLNFSWVEVLNRIKVEGRQYTLFCKMHRLNSPCQPLWPNNNFWVEIKGKKMRLSIALGGVQPPRWVTYDIVDVQ